jgi:hypothetical protein
MGVRRVRLMVQEPTLPRGADLLREGERLLARARASEQEITLVAFEFAGLGRLQRSKGRALTEAMGAPWRASCWDWPAAEAWRPRPDRLASPCCCRWWEKGPRCAGSHRRWDILPR